MMCTVTTEGKAFITAFIYFSFVEWVVDYSVLWFLSTSTVHSTKNLLYVLCDASNVQCFVILYSNLELGKGTS